MKNRAGAITFAFIIIVLLFVIFAFITNSKIFIERKMPSLEAKKIDMSLRGSIFTKDGYEVASSDQLYKASINTRSIDPSKRDFFINLFSIYTNIPKSEIERKMSLGGSVVISYRLSAADALNLKKLNQFLLRNNVFIEYQTSQGVWIPKQGIDVSVSGINRTYNYKNTLEPIIGYVQKFEDENITRIRGVKGIENSYEYILNDLQDGIVQGRRDIGFTIIMDAKAQKQDRKDGYNITLNIPLNIQAKIERILDRAKEKLEAKEVMAGVMDSKSGEVLAFASSNRFDPNNLRMIKNYSDLNINLIESVYEPGSTIKPIIYAILYEQHLIDPNEIIGLENGVYRHKHHVIHDTHKLKEGTPEDIILKSSNIGMVKIADKLENEKLYDGLSKFGFGQKSNIDLPYEKTGNLPSVRLLNRDSSTRNTITYGYGMNATFVQLLRAYAAFSNGGYLINPQIASHTIIKDKKLYKKQNQKNITQIISKDTASYMHDLLVKVVQHGTGNNAGIKDVLIGGKTGTTRIVREGNYIRAYNGSFFGFAQDSEKTYTLGVLVLESQMKHDYYGSRSAAPVFREIVQVLLDDGYLNYTTNN